VKDAEGLSGLQVLRSRRKSLVYQKVRPDLSGRIKAINIHDFAKVWSMIVRLAERCVNLTTGTGFLFVLSICADYGENMLIQKAKNQFSSMHG